MANDLNVVCISGRLTRDPELQYLQNKTALAKFALAVNRSWTKDGETKQETSFVDCVQFGRGAESTQAYLHKGAACIVRGRLRQETWDDRQTGAKRSKLTVIVEEITFLGGNDGHNAAPGRTTPASSQASRGQQPQPPEPAAADDIPF